MSLVARFHGSLGCLLEMWLSGLLQCDPFLTDQQSEETFLARSIDNWAPEDLMRVIQL